MEHDNKTTKYFTQWQNMKLSDSARARITANLAEYTAFHTTNEQAGGLTRSAGEGRTIPALLQFAHLRSRFMIAGMAALALMVTGGTSYAAQGSVPGDTLYPVKVEVNETVRSAFAFSNEAKAVLQAKLAAERLEEAETLAARGQLNAENATILSSRLQAHYTAATDYSSRAESAVPADVRALLAGTFRSYAATLTELNAHVAGNDGASFIMEISSYAESATDVDATEATTDAHVDVDIGVDEHTNNLLNVDISGDASTTDDTASDDDAQTEPLDTPDINIDLEINTDANVDTPHTDIDTSVRNATELSQ